MKLKLYVYAVTYYYGTGGEACGLRRRRCVVSVRLSLLFSISRSALGSCLLPNVTHQFFLFTLYIYLQEKHSSDVARRAVLPSVRRSENSFVCVRPQRV